MQIYTHTNIYIYIYIREFGQQFIIQTHFIKRKMIVEETYFQSDFFYFCKFQFCSFWRNAEDNWMPLVILRISAEGTKLKYREIEIVALKICLLHNHLSFNETCMNIYIYSRSNTYPTALSKIEKPLFVRVDWLPQWGAYWYCTASWRISNPRGWCLSASWEPN